MDTECFSRRSLSPKTMKRENWTRAVTTTTAASTMITMTMRSKKNGSNQDGLHNYPRRLRLTHHHTDIHSH